MKTALSKTRCVGFAYIVLFVMLLGLTSPVAMAQSSEAAGLRRQITQNHDEARKIFPEIRRLSEEKIATLAEMRAGAFCDGCMRTRSDILSKGEQFPHDGQRVIAATQEQLDAKAREFDQAIQRLYDRLKQLQQASSDLESQASRIEYEERMAKFKADQEAARQRLEQQRREFEASQLERAKQLSEAQDRIKQAMEQKDEERRQAAEADRQRLDSERTRRERDWQARRDAWSAAQANAPRPEISEEFRKMAQDIRGVAEETQIIPQLSPQQKAEQQRVQEMANQGLISAPPSFDLEGIQVAVDSTVSVWNRLMDVKSSAEGVGSAFDRLVTNDRPGFAERAQLILDNAGDTVALGDRVTGQLPSAVDALLTGDYDAGNRVQANLDRATGDFAGAADQRARTASPEYDLYRSVEDFRSTADAAVAPLQPFANNRERFENYAKAANVEDYAKVAQSTFDLAMDLRNPGNPGNPGNPAPQEAAPAQPRQAAPVADTPRVARPPADPVRWESQTNGTGPLGENAARMFQGGAYTELVPAQPQTLYQVIAVQNGRKIAYWSRTPPAAETNQTGAASVKIVVPPGYALYEGRATPSDKGDLILLETFDPAWVVK